MRKREGDATDGDDVANEEKELEITAEISGPLEHTFSSHLDVLHDIVSKELKRPSGSIVDLRHIIGHVLAHSYQEIIHFRKFL